MYNRKILFCPWKWVVRLLIISILFENIKIINILGTSFKPTHIIFLLAILIGILKRYVLKRDLLIGGFFLILPCLVLYRINDKAEWGKSYSIYFIMICFLMFAFRSVLEEFKTNYIEYVKLLLSVVAITQILGIIQFFCMNFKNYFFLQDIFGNFQYQPNIFNMSNGFYRAYSIYHEPSFFGLVTLTAVAVLFSVGDKILTKREYRALLILNISAVGVSLSASCLIIFLLLIVIQQFIKERDAVVKFASVVFLVIIFIILGTMTDFLAPATRLFTEVNLENSSGYERTTTQIMYIQKTLHYYPILGRGLGQEGEVDAIGKIGMYSAINNALAGIIVNFGFTSFIYYWVLLRRAIRNIKVNVHWLPIVVTILGIYASTGAYISVDTFNMVILLCAVGSITGEK